MITLRSRWLLRPSVFERSGRTEEKRPYWVPQWRICERLSSCCFRLLNIRVVIRLLLFRGLCFYSSYHLYDIWPWVATARRLIKITDLSNYGECLFWLDDHSRVCQRTASFRTIPSAQTFFSFFFPILPQYTSQRKTYVMLPSRTSCHFLDQTDWPTIIISSIFHPFKLIITNLAFPFSNGLVLIFTPLSALTKKNSESALSQQASDFLLAVAGWKAGVSLNLTNSSTPGLTPHETSLRGRRDDGNLQRRTEIVWQTCFVA